MTPSAAVAAYRSLHASGCFVLPNPWDAGTAVYLHHLGFKALASTSAGMAFSKARSDAPGAVSLEQTLAHLRELVQATPLPVNADFQAGFADDLEGLAANVVRCIATGVAGLSIEDATGDAASPLFEQRRAVERVKVARAAIDASGSGVLLTARCEAYLVGAAEPFRTAIDRLVAFAEAGADCLYAPGVRRPEEIAAIVQAVAPRPVNVLAGAPGFTVEQLAGLGVRRISVGAAMARAAWAGFIRSARTILDEGRFDGFAGATPFAELETLFAKAPRRA